MSKRGKSKKGLSGVIVTVLIILIAIIAVLILWQVLKTVLKGSVGEISLARVLVDFEVEKSSVIKTSDGNSLSLKIKRNIGKGELIGIRFVLENGTDSYINESPTNMQELFEETFTIDTTGRINSSTITRIKLAPIILTSSGKEVLGRVVEVYELGEEVGGEVPPSCVDECTTGDKQCFDSTQYQTCGEKGDGDSCLDWLVLVACPSGLSCVNGECVEEITTCTTISQPGVYVLTADIINWQGAWAENCMIITSNDVTLDCNDGTVSHSIDGFIDGSGHSGIYVSNRQNVKIKNCIISDFAYGIQLESSSGNNLTSNTLNSNTYGINILSSSNNNILTSNNVSSNSWGIQLSSSSGNNLTSNIVNSNSNYGIVLGASSNNILTSNTACGNNNADFACGTDTSDSGSDNIFTSVWPCSDGWPQLDRDYTQCTP